MEAKFRVGDKVTLKPIEPGWDDINPYYTDRMEKDCEEGRIFTVRLVGARRIDIGLWSVREDWIEHVLVSLDNI